MASCLGIYIENNIIKYAKVTKEHDIVKMETSGVKFYENLDKTIEQIVSETYSYKVPLSINLENERYNYFEMFSLLNEKDLDKAIQTEFELACADRGVNKNVLEGRYMLVSIPENAEKVKAIYISTNKSEINKKKQQLQKYPLRTISPLSISIVNNIEVGEKENSAIINIEEKTTITTITNGQVDRIDLLEEGMGEILEKINSKENSYAKAYDVLKATTIYTVEGKGLQDESGEYIEDIMPTLYNIVTKTKDILANNLYTTDKIYITGTGAIINNIDLYFQENFLNSKCEILKPYFIKNVNITKENVKDYIEVNSAIALALQGLGEGNKNIDFKGTETFEKIKDILNIEIGGKKKDTPSSGNESKFKIKFDLNESLDNIEKSMLRTAGSLFCAILIYIIGTSIISGMIKNKQIEVQEVIDDTNIQIAKVSSDIQTINSKTTRYEEMIQRLDDLNAATADANSKKNIIPNLLNAIMYRIAQGVQVTSIQNTTGRHIVINAQSDSYDQLGYFLSRIKEQKILESVKSNSGEMQNGVLRMTIEGDMP